ncbi:MAG: asparagine synthase-related protein [Candidatus Omnitrophica bacterium]|nr:asparagine synthase-related protein [Candidatus Omnitrophota bacterium]
MPGIIGIISKSSQSRNEERLRLMMGCMMHEPFYNSGTYINKKLGLYVGWICHKNSFADCMPIYNEKKDLALIFSGENFPEMDLTGRLKERGHVFDRSKANYIIHLYEEEGEDFISSLNGWFNGVLIDCQKEVAVIFNDRYGMQRIYYHENKDEFLFSSEAKSLLKICPQLRTLDLKGLGELFGCGCVLENRTLFPGISLLPGAALWAFRNGTCVSKSHYFQPQIWENQEILEKEAFYSRLKQAFLDILPRYLGSNERIGMSLTGGLDSRIIMAGTQKPAGSLPCYTFDGMYRQSFDANIAGKVARLCHQPHQVLQLGGEFLSDFQKYAEKCIYISDGCLDACGSYELYLNKFARNIAPIRITGDYGGEVLRGLKPPKAVVPYERLFSPDFVNHIRNALKLNAGMRQAQRLSLNLFKNAPWYGRGRLAIEQSQLTLRTPYMDNGLVALMYQAPRHLIGSDGFSLRLIADCNPALLNIATDRGVGRLSKGSSIILRIYREFLFKTEYCYNHGMPNWLAEADYIFAPLHIERLFLGRHKFHHFRIWFRNELSDYIRDILLDKRASSRAYLNPKFLEKAVLNHIKGIGNYTNEINKALTVELIQRLLIENET